MTENALESDDKKKVDEVVSKGVQPAEPMLKKISRGGKGKQTAMIVVSSVLVVLAGIGTGWMLSGGISASETGSESVVEEAASHDSKTEAGVDDESTFSDTAEGVLMEGGIEGEGTHYLDRNAGPDKQVYLTSTVIDLQYFVGKKVQVWGETVAAQNAPWLMDVGKLKVIE